MWRGLFREATENKSARTYTDNGVMAGTALLHPTFTDEIYRICRTLPRPFSVFSIVRHQVIHWPKSLCLSRKMSAALSGDGRWQSMACDADTCRNMADKLPKASQLSIEVPPRDLALAHRHTRGSGDASSDLDARRNRGCRRSLHRHPLLAAADDDQSRGHRRDASYAATGAPAAAPGPAKTLSGRHRATRPSDVQADGSEPDERDRGLQQLGEMARGWAGAVDVSRMSGGGRFRGPRNGESASAICRFTNSRPSTHGRNPATPGPIDDSTPNESTPPTIRPEGGHRSSRTAVPDERMLDPQHRGASRNPIASTTTAAPDGWESSDLVPCGIRLVEPTSERVFIPPGNLRHRADDPGRIEQACRMNDARPETACSTRSPNNLVGTAGA